MKRSLKSLLKYHVKSKDGHNGAIKDFLFNHDSWIVRYLDADFGSWFSVDRVLVPTIFLEEPDWKHNVFPVKLSKKDIESGPNLQDHMPVSRKYETELLKHYNLEPYWLYPFTNVTEGELLFPSRPLSIPPQPPSEAELDTNLRSFREVEGYRILAGEKEMGYVDDLIVDDDDWQIVYAVIDFSEWLLSSKKVLISIEAIEKISYVEQHAVLSVTAEKIKNAPSYDPESNLNKKDEEDLHDYFSWGMVS